MLPFLFFSSDFWNVGIIFHLISCSVVARLNSKILFEECLYTEALLVLAETFCPPHISLFVICCKSAIPLLNRVAYWSFAKRLSSSGWIYFLSLISVVNCNIVSSKRLFISHSHSTMTFHPISSNKDLCFLSFSTFLANLFFQ